MIGKEYTALDDGSFAFAVTSLDGFDSQKAYLSGQTSGSTQAVNVNVPDADVYIALTFDDGPTGRNQWLSERTDGIFAGRPEGTRCACDLLYGR